MINEPTDFCKENNLDENFPASENNIDTLLDRADLAQFENYYEVLDKISSRILEIDPDNEDGLFYKGISLFNFDESSKEALSYFDRVISIQGSRILLAYYGRIVIYFNAKEYEKALESCEKLIELSPEDPFAWESKSDILSMMNRKQEADKCFEMAEEFREKHNISH